MKENKDELEEVTGEHTLLHNKVEPLKAKLDDLRAQVRHLLSYYDLKC